MPERQNHYVAPRILAAVELGLRPGGMAVRVAATVEDSSTAPGGRLPPCTAGTIPVPVAQGVLVRPSSAGDPFTPCGVAGSLVRVVLRAARNAAPGDVFLLSPAYSSSDQSRNCHHRGAGLRQPVRSIGRGGHGGSPNINGK